MNSARNYAGIEFRRDERRRDVENFMHECPHGYGWHCVQLDNIMFVIGGRIYTRDYSKIRDGDEN